MGISAVVVNNLTWWRLLESHTRGGGGVWSDREAPGMILTCSGAAKVHPDATLTCPCPVAKSTETR